MADITIYHNPSCGTSRTVLSLILADPKWSDEQLLEFIVRHPILLQRPVVVTPEGTKLCRPADEVRSLLA